VGGLCVSALADHRLDALELCCLADDNGALERADAACTLSPLSCGWDSGRNSWSAETRRSCDPRRRLEAIPELHRRRRVAEIVGYARLGQAGGAGFCSP